MAEQNNVVCIKVIGVGGAGNNVVNRMVATGVQNVEFVAINTDRQDLDKIKEAAIEKIQIGEKITGGRGAGAKPEIGQRAAEESKAAVQQALEGANMVFITAGMGGGTGTGAAPIVAGLAREAGILTVGVVTKPFQFEGGTRKQNAEMGIKALEENVDALIIIPNERLKYVTDQKITFLNAFGIADDVLRQAVQSISELVNFSEDVLINLDFADVSAIMKDAGRAHMGVGRATGIEKAEKAAMAAVASPLLETSINGATGVLINITGSRDLELDSVETAANIVMEAVNPDANIIFGAAFDDTMEDEMRVTVIATGFEEKRSGKGTFSENAAGDDDFDILTKIFDRK
ncbi:MAG: cell division protein FtsZ [Oscillospiraceae bacterium]|nr:cell division protein FtsZ [Oscillospiraceae bacterium]